MNEQFKKDVLEGLSKDKKTLPSKYFYDEKGDQLFQAIMAMPEYYLTRAELEIISTKTTAILSSFEQLPEVPFEMIELGAGDGTKTIKILEKCIERGYDFRYTPVDISQHALQGLSAMLTEKLPQLKVTPKEGTYFNVLKELAIGTDPKIILFLGSNLGNLGDEDAARFLKELGTCMRPNDKLFLGVDLLKSRDIVLPAYNDTAGITREFNLNLLDRINRELGGNFDRNQFDHAPEYDENEGIARSYIKSLTDQVVRINSLDKEFKFKAGELIHTEISRKYTRKILEKITTGTQLEITAVFTDKDELFGDFVLTKVGI